MCKSYVANTLKIINLPRVALEIYHYEHGLDTLLHLLAANELKLRRYESIKSIKRNVNNYQGSESQKIRFQ